MEALRALYRYGTVIVAAMVAVQIGLARAAESTHWVGPFHALLAFAILGASGRLVYEAWRGPVAVACA